MAKEYNFQYTPLTGKLPGNSFVKQTEQAINELAGIVNEGAAQVEVITNLANTANDNSEEALEKANEALSTASRVYITLPNLEDADDYYDSQLYYFSNSSSANLPVEDTGFLEVKTNDTKTAAEQVFIADNTGLCYFRHGDITSEEVGSETVYSVTWSTWSSALASEDYVQGELLNYLPLSGGTMTTGNTLITMGNGESYVRNWGNGLYLGGTKDSNNASGLVLFTDSNANGFQLQAGDGTTFKRMVGKPDGTLTWNSQNILTASNYNSYALPLSGGTMTGNIGFKMSEGRINVDASQSEAGRLRLLGGSGISNGAQLLLNGKSQSQNAGQFQLGANDGTNEASLKGYADGTLTWDGQPLLPVGIVQAFAGTTIPNGWLLCDGSAVSRTTYAGLYAVIGDTYGNGDGSTTFNLPNLIDKFIEGSATSGTVKSAGLPNITGSQLAGWRNDSAVSMLIANESAYHSGAFDNSTYTAVSNQKRPALASTDIGGYPNTLQFDASKSNAIYGNSTTVQPPALTMRYIIKY